MTSQLFRKIIKLLKRFAVEWSSVGTDEWQDCLLELREIRSEKVLTVAATTNTCPTAVPLLFLINKCSWRTAGDLGFLIKVTLCLLFFLFPTGSVVRRMKVKQSSCIQEDKRLGPTLRVEKQKEEKSPGQWWHCKARLRKIIPYLFEPLLLHSCYMLLKENPHW